MRVLIVKTSSLGDLVHTFPALTDAAHAHPDAEFHWLAEEALLEVPRWHPAVTRVLPIALRRWRRAPWQALRSGEPAALWRRLRRDAYDCIIDAQGLIKSALPARTARGPLHGFDWHSVREPLASLACHRRHRVPRELHAIDRIRRLFSAALDYPLPDTPPQYGLASAATDDGHTLVFLHATTWPSKHWPEAYWTGLARRAARAGYRVLWPWHGEQERARAERLAARGGGRVLPSLNLDGLRRQLAQAAGVVGVDTGLAHLAAALGVPAVTLYGPTAPARTGARGPRQRNLAADRPCAPCLQRRCLLPGTPGIDPPCFTPLEPERVWQALRRQMEIRP